MSAAMTPHILVIRTFWNKVERDETQPFGSRVLPEYELKDSHSTMQHGYANRKEWQNRVEKLKGFEGFDDQGRAKFDLGRTYGIHSYQLVSLE